MAPIGAGVTAVVAIIKSFSGRGYAMWWAGTGGLVGVSMLVRLIEAFVTQGTGGVGGGS